MINTIWDILLYLFTLALVLAKTTLGSWEYSGLCHSSPLFNGKHLWGKTVNSGESCQELSPEAAHDHRQSQRCAPALTSIIYEQIHSNIICRTSSHLNVISSCILPDLGDPVHPRKVASTMALNLWGESNMMWGKKVIVFESCHSKRWWLSRLMKREGKNTREGMFTKDCVRSRVVWKKLTSVLKIDLVDGRA